MRFSTVAILGCLVFGTAMHGRAADEEAGKEPRSRQFEFNYGASLSQLPAGAKLRVWLPVPPSTDAQTVAIKAQKLPAKATLETEPEFGNQMLYFSTTAPKSGTLDFNVTFDVQRREVRTAESAEGSEEQISASQRERFLDADALVPIDGKPLELIDGLDLSEDIFERGRQLYDRVDEHMSYKKEGTGWGRGDVLWACESRYGNCTDFHSLFISLARSQKMPARFEIGFSLPKERGEGKIAGYHCWAYFLAEGRGWVPVDISEADKNPDMVDYYYGNLTEDRLKCSTGRDIVLAPAQDGPKLNFLVFPYVEVDGEPLAKESIKPAISFKDHE